MLHFANNLRNFLKMILPESDDELVWNKTRVRWVQATIFHHSTLRLQMTCLVYVLVFVAHIVDQHECILTFHKEWLYHGISHPLALVLLLHSIVSMPEINVTNVLSLYIFYTVNQIITVLSWKHLIFNRNCFCDFLTVQVFVLRQHVKIKLLDDCSKKILIQKQTSYKLTWPRRLRLWWWS